VAAHQTPASPRHVLGGYQDHAVSAGLAMAAEGLWFHASPLAGGLHRGLPDPSVNLVFRCIRRVDGRAEAPRRATPVWQDSTLDEDWRQSVRALLDRSWRGVRGQG
jgi:hypothetical protein